MNLNTLQKTVEKPRKRQGRGYGSGRGGHTVGRGSKGRKARGKVPQYFFGGAMGASFIKRLPLLRGKGKLKPRSSKPIGIAVKYLNMLPAESTVDIALLVKHRIVTAEEAHRYGVKILGGGTLSHAVTIMVPVTQGARQAIENAQGTVVTDESVAQQDSQSSAKKNKQTLKSKS